MLNDSDYSIYNNNIFTCFNVKKIHDFTLSNASFLQSPSFQQAQSALIGQLTQCIVIGRTPQTRVRNVTPLSIIVSFSFQSKYKDS